ncbi:ABC transporter ATP-binding protein [Chromatiales bacterium (ex Bugula neritina AB1)]|nr:ABC transporter ATP-binding protein [Chromatiales bacterium (ex Bugula neritina AB1)]
MREAIIETRDLTMRFGGVTAVNNVNFTLRERELRCLIGPNGAGKSTFFKCLTGQYVLRHENGRVYLRGQDVTGWQPYEIVRLGVGIKTQVPSVMNGLSVYENIWLSARKVNNRRAADKETRQVLEQLELGDLSRRLVGEMAHGERQIVELGIVVAQRPQLVLLDEPAAGITGSETEKLVTLIHRMNEEAALVVVDHDMQFVRMLNADITVFHQGSVLIEGAPDTVLSDKKVREVYVGNRAA